VTTPQYADPLVSRVKFDRQVEEFRALEAHHRSRGWLLVRAEFPEVVVLLATAKTAPIAIVTGVRFDYTNYDAEPPSVQLVHPLSGEPYVAAQAPIALNRALPPQPIAIPGAGDQRQVLLTSHQPLMQAHGPEEIPFLCLAGVREYHAHPAHSGDHWDLHRPVGAGRLVRLLEVIARYGIEPITGFNVQLKPVVGFNFGAAPE